MNTGFAPIEIPVSPHLSDLQPPDASEPFTYFSLSLVIYLDGTGEKQALGIGWVDLYGSAQHDGTMLTLEPGQWVRVKSKIKLHTWPSAPVPAKLTARFWLRKNLFTAQGGDKRFLQITNLYPNPTQFASIPVRFTPTRSEQPSLPQTH
jgi:hypothetical protein